MNKRTMRGNHMPTPPTTPEEKKLAAIAMADRFLQRLRPLFHPSAELAFVMRLPDNPDATMIITNDDLAELGKAVLHAAGVRTSTDLDTKGNDHG